MIGFGSEIKEQEIDPKELLSKVLPEDLLSFGLIPEFIGRLPVIASLNQLDEEALIEILTKPKNALVKQYQKMLELDNVELEFEEEALREIAKQAIERKTGARGLRSIIEGIMLDVMYDLPSRDDVQKCIITQDAVVHESEPKFILKDGTIIEEKRKTSA